MLYTQIAIMDHVFCITAFGLYSLRDSVMVAWSLPSNINHYVVERFDKSDVSTVLTSSLKPVKILDQAMDK